VKGAGVSRLPVDFVGGRNDEGRPRK